MYSTLLHDTKAATVRGYGWRYVHATADVDRSDLASAFHDPSYIESRGRYTVVVGRADGWEIAIWLKGNLVVAVTEDENAESPLTAR